MHHFLMGPENVSKVGIRKILQSNWRLNICQFVPILIQTTELSHNPKWIANTLPSVYKKNILVYYHMKGSKQAKFIWRLC